MLAVVLTPFSNNELLLNAYLVFIPFLVLHWILNNDTCALTELEAYLSGKPVCQTFMDKLVGSVYRINNRLVYCVVGVLYGIVVYKKYY